MRKVVLIMTASIDGYVAAPNGNPVGAGDEPPELKRWKLERIRRAGAHIMGRVTYEGMASFWPTSTDDYAAPMNEIPKVVFSKTLQAATWPDSSIARGDLADEIAALRAQPGGEIIAWGGAAFAQSLSRAGLVNEYAIVTQPVAYGGASHCSTSFRKRYTLMCFLRRLTRAAPRSIYSSHSENTYGRQLSRRETSRAAISPTPCIRDPYSAIHAANIVTQNKTLVQAANDGVPGPLAVGRL